MCMRQSLSEKEKGGSRIAVRTRHVLFSISSLASAPCPRLPMPSSKEIISKNTGKLRLVQGVHRVHGNLSLIHRCCATTAIQRQPQRVASHVLNLLGLLGLLGQRYIDHWKTAIYSVQRTIGKAVFGPTCPSRKFSDGDLWIDNAV